MTNINKKILIPFALFPVMAFADGIQENPEQDIIEVEEIQLAEVPPPKTFVTGRLQYNVSNIQTRDGALPSQDTIGWLDARLGAQTYQPIDHDLTAFGIMEFDISSKEAVVGMDNKKNELMPRYVFAGIDSKEYGKVSVGRVGSGLLELVNLTDFFAFNGGGETIASRASMIDTSASGVTRQDNTIEYGHKIGGLTFSTGYIMDSGVFSDTGVDKGFNGALSYNFTLSELSHVKPVVAFQKTYAADRADNDADSYTFWGIGAEYYYADFGTSFIYSEDKLDGTLQDLGTNKGLETMVRWTGFDKLDLRAGYFMQKNDVYGDKMINDIVFDAHYFLSPKMRLIGEYSFRNADEIGSESGKNKKTSSILPSD
ncbi:porin [Grimontia sp. S25]|uniref:Porin n=1 Tax=Grimontia sedimenti TaxID=2711294 RepID=A0A6M1RE04_9GAMM|nr:porin [Grimontia sedimenti]NGN98404.1 porin [Grimontia sedimenti]